MTSGSALRAINLYIAFWCFTRAKNSAHDMYSTLLLQLPSSLSVWPDKYYLILHSLSNSEKKKEEFFPVWVILEIRFLFLGKQLYKFTNI